MATVDDYINAIGEIYVKVPNHPDGLYIAQFVQMISSLTDTILKENGLRKNSVLACLPMETELGAKSLALYQDFRAWAERLPRDE